MKHRRYRHRLCHGDVVILQGYIRPWMVIKITAQDIRDGCFVERPGLHLLGGFWYTAKDSDGVVRKNPLNRRCFGKILNPRLIPPKKITKWMSIGDNFNLFRHETPEFAKDLMRLLAY